MKLCLRCNQYLDEHLEKCPNDGSILENVGKDPLIGALINNRYLVDSVIGKGSSGIVYKARRLGRGEMVVAIKVLHSYIGAAGSALDRFLREAQAASKLRNPHIITIWDTGVTEDGQPYFVMDYLEGNTLGDLIKEKGNLEPKRVLSLLNQICEALGEAHRQGIVHRDLKPENIILQENDHGHDYIKLLDFGIADSPQHAQSSFKLEKPRTVSGSPAYMSPEQCQGLDLDGRSDIYSLAIVVFEMLTGCRPFPQLENVNVMVLHVNEPPMTLSAVRSDLTFPKNVENVISRALSKQPFERQTSVHEFLLQLEMAWQNQENALSSVAKLVTQPRSTLSENPSIEKKEEYSKAVTVDDLPMQAGNELIPAWGSISLECSNKATILSDNNPGSQLGALLAQKTPQQNTLQQEILQQETPQQSPPQQNTLQQEILQQNTKEQSTTKSKTVDRLLEAAKRGQTGPHKKLSLNDLPRAQPVKSSVPGPEKIAPIVAKDVSVFSVNPMAQPNIENAAGTRVAVANSGRFAVQDKQANLASSTSQSTLYNGANSNSTNANSVSAVFSQNNDSTLLNSTSASSYNAIPAKPINTSSELSYAATGEVPISTAETVQSYSQRAMNDTRLASIINNEVQLPTDQLVGEKRYLRSKPPELLTSSRSGIENAHDEEFHVKQKYITTLSRLEGWKKAKQTDNALLSTRARAALLKAESVRPPVNLWFLGGTIGISICLLFCAYIVYSALVAPIPSVTLIDVLRISGKYEQIIAILEHKKLSQALTDPLRDELSEAYLHMARESLAQNKPEQALSFLSKADPKSPSAAQANALQAEIIKSQSLLNK